jgi:hypothetical protein
MEAFGQLWRLALLRVKSEFSFTLIGDQPSPATFVIEGCDFYSLERQKATGLKIASRLPLRHYSSKNIGYLLAMRTRPAMLFETDDHNMPLPEFWNTRKLKTRLRVLAGNGWTNAYFYFAMKTFGRAVCP